METSTATICRQDVPHTLVPQYQWVFFRVISVGFLFSISSTKLVLRVYSQHNLLISSQSCNIRGPKKSLACITMTGHKVFFDMGDAPQPLHRMMHKSNLFI
jgi:hypothetical protein